MTPSAEIEPRPHWWKASALTTRPTLPPHCSVLCLPILFVCLFLTEPEIPVSQIGKLGTVAIVGISVGVFLLVFIILVICCCLYQRQKRQIDEYKQLYFLQQSDYQVGSNLIAVAFLTLMYCM